MAYVGNSPLVGQYRKLDNLTFDGSTTSFPITVGGDSVNPPSSFAMLISLNQVILNPGIDFSITASTLSFAVPPAPNTPFFGLIFGDTLYTGTPSDNTVSTGKIQDGAITYAKLSTNTQSRLTALQIIFGV